MPRAGRSPRARVRRRRIAKAEVAGVRILGPKDMVKLLRKAPVQLRPDEVSRLADQIDGSFVPAVAH